MRVLTILCVTGCAAAMSVTTGYGQTYACLSASDSVAIGLRNYVITLVTATDSETVADRVHYKLPAITANKVKVETAPSICAIAGARYNAAVRPPGSPALSSTLVVIKVGTTRYVVTDTIYSSGGEFTTTVIFDRNWKTLAGWDS